MLYVIWVIVMILGTVTGYTIRDEYKVLVDGVLGLVLLFYMYRPLLNLKKEKSDNEGLSAVLIKFPENIKVLILSFLGSGLIYLTGWKVYVAVLYLVQLISSGV